MQLWRNIRALRKKSVRKRPPIFRQARIFRESLLDQAAIGTSATGE
jgi:hypothetical protein